MLQNVTKCDTFRAPHPVLTGLSSRQVPALALLLDGRPVSDVAEELDVCRQTIHRWKASPAFAQQLARLQANHLHAIASGASRVLVKSLSLILRNIDNSNCNLAVKVLSSLKVHRFISPPPPDDPQPDQELD